MSIDKKTNIIVTNNELETSMRMLRIDNIKGNEVLARDILSGSGIVLMSAGTHIKKEYRLKLKELGVDAIYIEDEYSQGIVEETSSENSIKIQCEHTIKNIIERFSYIGTKELKEVSSVAEEIIMDVLEEPGVMYNISGIRDNSMNTYSHSINVCTLSVFIALNMKLPKSKAREIAIGSLLHDIGFQYIGKDLSQLDRSKLTDNEKKELKKHVIYGYEALKDETWLTSVSKDIILYHHEKIDGTGYPFRVLGNKIKIGSKIVAVCNEFDKKIYGFHDHKVKVHHAFEYIMSLSGTWFDNNVVKTFYDCVAAYPNGTTVITSDNNIGIVIRQNKRFPTRPIIRLIKDQYGDKYHDWVEKDLTKNLSLFIKDTLDTI